MQHQAHEADHDKVETETVRTRVLSIDELRRRIGLPPTSPSAPRPSPPYERPRIVRREAEALAG